MAVVNKTSVLKALAIHLKGEFLRLTLYEVQIFSIFSGWSFETQLRVSIFQNP